MGRDIAGQKTLVAPMPVSTIGLGGLGSRGNKAGRSICLDEWDAGEGYFGLYAWSRLVWTCLLFFNIYLLWTPSKRSMSVSYTVLYDYTRMTRYGAHRYKFPPMTSSSSTFLCRTDVLLLTRMPTNTSAITGSITVSGPSRVGLRARDKNWPLKNSSDDIATNARSNITLHSCIDLIKLR